MRLYGLTGYSTLRVVLLTIKRCRYPFQTSLRINGSSSQAVTRSVLQEFIKTLDIPEDERQRLKGLVSETAGAAEARGYIVRTAAEGVGRDEIERYAAYRVGYHRGLDALRANGWRGSGYVPSTAPPVTESRPVPRNRNP